MTSSSSGLAAPFAVVRFATGEGSEARLGLVAGDRVRGIGPDELGAPDLNTFLSEAPASWERLRRVAEQADAAWHRLADVTLTAPVTPRQVL
ncbi:MAG TPA: hydrolase, partial [Agromyces sp.]